MTEKQPRKSAQENASECVCKKLLEAGARRFISDLLAPYFFFFSSGPHALMKLFLSRFYATTAPAPAPVVGSCIL